jgi:hypothetical protein
MTSVFGGLARRKIFCKYPKDFPTDLNFKHLLAVLSDGRAAVALEFLIVKRVWI